MARGKLPRSYKIPIADPLYATAYKTNAYLYDTALAIIATVGGRKYDLAAEIVEGALASQMDNKAIPFVSNYETAAGIGTYITHSTSALMAYALGYYLEYRPTATNYCIIAKAVKDILNYLQTQREFAYNQGLITDGTVGNLLLNQDGTLILTQDGVPISIEGLGDTAIKTETNILGFFAFKQAGKIFNQVFYTNTSTELKDAIISKLWIANKLALGLSANGVPDLTNVLHTSAYGVLFMYEIGDQEKATTLLSKCEVFATIDEVNGAIGYKAFLTTSDRVWFEMSYAVALGYYKGGNSIKHQQIVNELNRFIDTTDGGVRGSLLKNYNSEMLLDFKAVGSTAWAVISNNLKGSVFAVRNNVTATVACTAPYYNTSTGVSFTKQGCGVDTTPSTLLYTVPAGRYMSWTSVAAANALRDEEVSDYGQAYANIHGSCISVFTVGNQLTSGNFMSQNCGAGMTPENYAFVVQPNTFYAATLAEANQLAVDYIQANGQAAANLHGTCVVQNTSTYVYLRAYRQGNTGYSEVIVKAYAVSAVNTDLIIGYDLQVNGTYGGTYTITIYNGDRESVESSIYNTYDYQTTEIAVTITSITPSTYNGRTYVH